MSKTIEFKRMGNIIQFYIEDDKIMMKSPEYCGEVSTVLRAAHSIVYGAYGAYSTIGSLGYSTDVLQATKYIHEIQEACEMLLNGGTI